MSICYPNHPEFATEGEKIIFTNVLSQLPDEWRVFYEPIINGRQPDYVLFHPDYGVAVIEVKDYLKETIYAIKPAQWKIRVGHDIKTVTSPNEQVRQYKHEIYNLLSMHEQLKSNNIDWSGNLKFPVVNFCCFPCLSTNEIKSIHINKIIPNKMIIAQEESLEPELFIHKLFAARKKLFKPTSIQKSDIDLVVEALYPKYHLEHTKETNESYHISNNLLINKKVFDNYVDEIFYVVNLVAHFYNYKKMPLNYMVIVYNSKRIARPSTEKYLKLLRQTLYTKNIGISRFQNENQVQLISYDQLTAQDIKDKTYFLVDFSLIPNKDVSDILFLLEQYKGLATFVVTSNTPIRNI